MNNSALSIPNPDNDVLDCLGCEVGDGILGVASDLFGANLCCIGGTCNKVLTRVACRQAGGTPVHYRMDSLPGVSTGAAHGIEVGPDGALYMTGPGNVITRVDLTSNAQTTMGSTPSFPTGVTVDTAGNVYVTNRCGHTLTKIAPGGIATPFAGTGVAGHTGDGGPATAAQIDAPDGIAVDPAGNVYFTESGFLGISCGVFASATESIRMVDPSGIIHTVAGAGTGPVGGPALGAGFFIPYGLRRSVDGTLLIGEAGYQRALRIDASGTLRLLAGAQIGPIGVHSGYGGPAALAEFYQNCGIADDPDGNVFIAPMEDNLIALVDTLGSVISIAGTGDGSTYGMPSGDGGPALLGQAGCPEDVDVGPDGTVYFSDLFTQRIRRLTRAPF
jgi:streptogramin lyase